MQQIIQLRSAVRSTRLYRTPAGTGWKPASISVCWAVPAGAAAAGALDPAAGAGAGAPPTPSPLRSEVIGSAAAGAPPTGAAAPAAGAAVLVHVLFVTILIRNRVLLAQLKRQK